MDLLGYGIGTKDVNEQIQGELGASGILAYGDLGVKWNVAYVAYGELGVK